MSAHMWFGVWNSWLETSNLHALMSSEFEKFSISVQKSKTNHRHDGMGVFAWNNLGRGDFIGYYYGFMVYCNLSGRPRQHRT